MVERKFADDEADQGAGCYDLLFQSFDPLLQFIGIVGHGVLPVAILTAARPARHPRRIPDHLQPAIARERHPMTPNIPAALVTDPALMALVVFAGLITAAALAVFAVDFLIQSRKDRP